MTPAAQREITRAGSLAAADELAALGPEDRATISASLADSGFAIFLLPSAWAVIVRGDGDPVAKAYFVDGPTVREILATMVHGGEEIHLRHAGGVTENVTSLIRADLGAAN